MKFTFKFGLLQLIFGYKHTKTRCIRGGLV